MSDTTVAVGTVPVERNALAVVVWMHVAAWTLLSMSLVALTAWAICDRDDSALLFGAGVVCAAPVAGAFVVPAALLVQPRSARQVRTASTLAVLLAFVTSIPVAAWCGMNAVQALGPVEAAGFVATTATLLALLVALVAAAVLN